MVPIAALKLGVAGIGLLAAFSAGVAVENWRLTARYTKQQLEQSRAAVTYIERNLERQADVDRKTEAQRARLAADLKEARRANEQAMQQPVVCPPSGKLGDVVFPGLRQRLLDARAQRRARAAAGAASLPSP